MQVLPIRLWWLINRHERKRERRIEEFRRMKKNNVLQKSLREFRLANPINGQVKRITIMWLRIAVLCATEMKSANFFYNNIISNNLIESVFGFGHPSSYY